MLVMHTSQDLECMTKNVPRRKDRRGSSSSGS